MTEGHLHVGTSGWSYRHWRGDFYPAGLAQRRWLTHYEERFDSVEVNATFYGLLRPNVFSAWARDAPPGFVFALKGSRFLTHVLRLNNIESGLERFFERAHLLGEHLGPVLWQLPPNLERDHALLEAFIERLPTRIRHVFEFRHASWFEEKTYALLRASGAALCVAHRGAESSPDVATADFVYLRFHGTDKRYDGAYGRRRLTPWANRIRAWRTEGVDVYAYFNNDIGGHAPRDAMLLRECLIEDAHGPSAARNSQR